MAQLKDSLVQGSMRVTDTLYSNIINTSILNTDSLNTNENITLTSTSGDSPAIIFDRGSTNTDWKLLVTAGKLSFQSRTGTNAFTERGYFADNSGAFQASKYNGLTLTAATTGFTIAGGTTSKTLTVSDTVTLKTGYATHLAYYSAAGTISGHSLAYFSDEFGSSVANKKNELVLGNATAKASNGSAWGQIALYSPGTKGTYINSAENSTSWYTATLQAKTGTIAYTDDITTAIQGLDSTLPTGSAASKTLTALTIADGKMTAATFSDISIGASQVSSGTLAIAHGGTGLATADAHKILIGPSSGAAAAPTWRILGAADLPIATSSAVGGISASTGLSVNAAGALSVVYGTANGTALGTASAGAANSAARSDHVHPLPALTDCTGTLTVAKGGTGLTTTTNVNAVLIGNSSDATGALQTVATSSGAFYATAGNAQPSFGTLPIAQGGTSATTAQAARASLGTPPYIQGVFYGTCGTAAGTKAKQVILTNGEGFSLETGVVIFVKFTYASAKATMTMEVSADGGTTYCAIKNLYRYDVTAMADGTTTTGWRAGAVVCFVYDGTGWERIFWENSTYTVYNQIYCATSAGTAAKVGSGAQYVSIDSTSRYFMVTMVNANTAAGALTLNINGKGAKPIYINGEPSNATNHTLPQGFYLVHYDGTNYYFRTDNKMTGNITGHADQDLALSGGTMTGALEVSNLTTEPQVKVSSAAGNIYLYSQPTATGKRGIYSANAAGTGTNILTIDQDNFISLHKQVHLIDASIITDMSTVTKGVAPTTENQYRTLEWHDVNGARLAQVEYGALTNGESRLNLYVLEASTGTGNTGYGGIVIRKYVGNNGNFVAIFNANTGNFSANTVSGAVWNDYAEYRTQLEKIEPGRAIKDLDDGHVVKTEERLIPGAQVVSDTFGFALGETKDCQTPVAVSGRVLVYPYRNRYEYHAGMAVCSAPNGTVDIMTREEIQKYPDAIIGIVSEIPEYEEWGENPVKVNNRIWIKVK